MSYETRRTVSSGHRRAGVVIAVAGKKLVMGASGFLGSHVVKNLVARGDEVRVLLRPISDTRGIDGLPVERRFGDIFDLDAVRDAMTGCDVVYYCVVDARSWLRNSKPLWRTNVDGLRGVLEVASQTCLSRFVYTSSIGTIGRVDSGQADETTIHNWRDRGGEYIRTRIAGEELVLHCCAEKNLPGVAMCVSNTYGPGDWLPTPHGGMVRDVVRQRLPFYIDGWDYEVVGVADAAEALVLGGERGRVGERYIVSERFMKTSDVYRIACTAVGVEPPRWGVPIQVLSGISHVANAVTALLGRDSRLTPLNVRLMNVMSPMDHSKATRELGWYPRPVAESIAEAAHFFTTRRGGTASADGPKDE